jgi:hypothetical protein
MTAFVPPIRRKNTAKGHYYADAVGTRVTGVTTFINDGSPKPALINWAGDTTADAAIDRWDELAAMKPAARLKELKGARWAEKDKAAKRGTEIHGYGEQLVKGETVDVPDELLGYVEAYARFLDAFKVDPDHVEFSVASYKHGYAGTGDLIANLVIPRVGTKRLLIDLKSSRSGIFGETALQLAAYRYADVLLDGDAEEPMPEVDDCAAVHIRGDGADLIPVTTSPEIFRDFLYVQQVARFTKISRDLVGAPISPAAHSPYRLTRTETQ